MASLLQLLVGALAFAPAPRPAPPGTLPVPQGTLNASTCGPIGSPERWAGLAERLARGQPVTIFAIGSSLVGVHGGCTAPAPALQSKECFHRCPSCCGSRCGVWGRHGGWALRFFHWLNESYPVRARSARAERPSATLPSAFAGDLAGHRLYNLGEPGGNLVPAIVACPRTYLGTSAPDLVLLDLHTAGMHGSGGRGQVERLTRMLLAAPSRPLVLVVRFAKLSPPPRQPPPKGSDDGEGGHDSVVSRAIKQLVSHYSLPSLGIDDCFARTVASSVPFGSKRYSGSDGLHPSSDGSWLIAEGLIALAERGLAQLDGGGAAAANASTPSAAAARAAAARAAPLPAPIHAQPSRVGLSCYTFDRAGYDAAVKTKPRVVGDKAKPQSITGENGGGPAGVVPAILAYSHGWRFIEREIKSSTPYKPGLVAEAAGALLALALDIPPRVASHVSVDVLRSWAGHGVARLSCAEGCACEPLEIDAHRRESKTSTLESVHVRVQPLDRARARRRRERRALQDATTVNATAADAADAAAAASALFRESMSVAPVGACVLHLEVLNTTSSGAHRFKLARIVVEADFDPSNATAVSPLRRRRRLGAVAEGLRRRRSDGWRGGWLVGAGTRLARAVLR
jgi:hypothetical protein